MNTLQKIVYHDDDDCGCRLEVQFFDDKIYFSSWLGKLNSVFKFKLDAVQARSLAEDILEIIPDPAILEDNLAAIQG
jgi:hypothetical protein